MAQTYELGDTEFSGMDARVAPEQLPPSVAQLAQNGIVEGGGAFRIRPGWRGVLASLMGGPVYCPYGCGNSLLFAATATGEVGQPGRLWRYNLATATLTEITKPGGVRFAFTSGGRGVHLTRYGRFVYGVDAENAAAPLFRVDASAFTGEEVPGLTAPTIGAATITRQVLDAPAAGDFITRQGATAPAGLMLNSSFESVNGSNEPDNWTAPDGYDTAQSRTGNAFNTPQQGSRSLQVRGNRAVVQTAAAPALPGAANAAEIAVGPGKVRNYAAMFWLNERDEQKRNTMLLDFGFLDVAGNRLGSETTTLGPFSHSGSITSWPLKTKVFGAGAMAADPVSIRLFVEGLRNQADNGGDGLYLDRLQVFPVNQFLAATAAAGLVRVSCRSQVWADLPGGNTLVDLTNDLGTNQTAGLWLRRTLPTLRDLSAVVTVGVPLTWVAAVGDVKPGLRLGLLRQGETKAVWTERGIYSSDSSRIYFDLSSLGERSKIVAYYLQVLDDCNATEGGNLFDMGPLYDEGGLTPGAGYFYRVSESRDVSGVGDGIESLGSALSAEVVAGDNGRTGTLRVAPKVNATATTLLIWRLGGSVSGAPLVAEVPVGANATGPGWSWVAPVGSTPGTFTDGVPDSVLQDATDIYQLGRDSFPAGCQVLGVHQSRLIAAKDGTIYCSWLLEEGKETGLYTTLAPDPSDDYANLKGASFTITTATGGDRSQNITGFEKAGTTLLISRVDSFSVLSGFEPGNYAAQNYLESAGIGCASGRGFVLFKERPFFTSTRGVNQFTNGLDNIVPFSEGLNPLLTADLLRSAALLSHDRFLFLLVSGAAYVFDSGTDANVKGWVKWTLPAGVTSFTSAVSLDAERAYFGGSDGQVYRMGAPSEFGDKQTPAGGAASVTMALVSRRHGQQDARTEIRYGQGTCCLVEFEADTAAPITANWTVREAGGQSRSGTWNFPAGRGVARARNVGRVSGVAHQFEMSVTTAGSFRLLSYLLHLTEGGVRR